MGSVETIKKPSGYPGGSLDGRVALVTGSGRGIGRGIALELASKGASVVINYANTIKGAEEVVKEIEKLGSKGLAIKADVTKPAEVDRMFKQAIDHFGRLDIVMSNSGTEMFKAEDQITEEDFDQVFNLNTKGTRSETGFLSPDLEMLFHDPDLHSSKAHVANFLDSPVLRRASWPKISPTWG
jgi:3-oxoacyl-[acyl-carrier protein] reductase